MSNAEGRDSFHALANARNVDDLGTAEDRDVFRLVDAADTEPSRQDVHLDALPAVENAALTR